MDDLHYNRGESFFHLHPIYSGTLVFWANVRQRSLVRVNYIPGYARLLINCTPTDITRCWLHRPALSIESKPNHWGFPVSADDYGNRVCRILYHSQSTIRDSWPFNNTVGHCMVEWWRSSKRGTGWGREIPPYQVSRTHLSVNLWAGWEVFAR